MPNLPNFNAALKLPEVRERLVRACEAYNQYGPDISKEMDRKIDAVAEKSLNSFKALPNAIAIGKEIYEVGGTDLNKCHDLCDNKSGTMAKICKDACYSMMGTRLHTVFKPYGCNEYSSHVLGENLGEIWSFRKK